MFFLEEHKKSGLEIPEDELIKEDDHIETILEYAINISSATPNENAGTIPTHDDIDNIYEKLLTIKTSIGFYEMTAEIPQGGNEFDHLLRTNVMTESMDVRGIGYGIHIREIFLELFTPHNQKLIDAYGFSFEQLFDAGSYQCKRAENFISENDNPTFKYAADGTSKTISLDKEQIKKIYKITVTFEQLGFISSNLKILVNNGVLKPDYKWSWIISIYDLMVFADILKGEGQFQEYLDHRLELYEREDVQFFDEIDLLGYFLENGFPIPVQDQNSILSIHGYSRDLDQYYTKEGLGYPENFKPSKLEKPQNKRTTSQPNKAQKRKKNRRKASKKSRKANRKRKK